MNHIFSAPTLRSLERDLILRHYDHEEDVAMARARAEADQVEAEIAALAKEMEEDSKLRDYGGVPMIPPKKVKQSKTRGGTRKPSIPSRAKKAKAV